MYFGNEMMWTFTFVPVGFALVMAVGSALALVYPVGRSRGKTAVARYVRACSLLLVVGGALDLAYAAVSGQWNLFLRAYGLSPIIEMALLGTMFVGAMWMMATSYVASKKD